MGTSGLGADFSAITGLQSDVRLERRRIQIRVEPENSLILQFSRGLVMRQKNGTGTETYSSTKPLLVSSISMYGGSS